MLSRHAFVLNYIDFQKVIQILELLRASNNTIEVSVPFDCLRDQLNWIYSTNCICKSWFKLFLLVDLGVKISVVRWYWWPWLFCFLKHRTSYNSTFYETISLINTWQICWQSKTSRNPFRFYSFFLFNTEIINITQKIRCKNEHFLCTAFFSSNKDLSVDKLLQYCQSDPFIKSVSLKEDKKSERPWLFTYKFNWSLSECESATVLPGVFVKWSSLF